jgi:hypothetical protein
MAAGPSADEEFLFDLRGFTPLPRALSPAELAALNGWVREREVAIREIVREDRALIGYQPRQPGRGAAALGGAQIQSYHTNSAHNEDGPIDDGLNLQYLYEAGAPFEALIDHPAWFSRVRRYLGRSQPFLHEMFMNLRGPGGYIGCHGGGPVFDDAGKLVHALWGAAASAGGRGEVMAGPDGSHRGHRLAWQVRRQPAIGAVESLIFCARLRIHTCIIFYTGSLRT